MNPVLFDLGPIEIHWYGILVATALGMSYWLARRNVRRYGMDPDQTDGIFLKVIVAIFVGARLAYVISEWDYFRVNLWEIIRIDHGGLGSHGAIFMALVCGIFWTKKTGVSYWKLADAVTPALPVGHIFVRLGNFINGELYGPPTTLPWGVKFPGTAGPAHPSQLYELLTSLIILPLALQWSVKPRYPGYAFLRVLLAHSLVRFFMDFLRQPGQTFTGLVLTQYIALGLAVFCAVLIWYLGKGKTKQS
jgi:phosphatidylglycerol:prolipoprotein diacylglycerol transferase